MLEVNFKFKNNQVVDFINKLDREQKKVSSDNLAKIAKESSKSFIEEFKAVAPSSNQATKKGRFKKIKMALRFIPLIKKESFFFGTLGFKDAPQAFWLEYGHRLVKKGMTFRKDGQKAVWGFINPRPFFRPFYDQKKGLIIQQAEAKLQEAFGLKW